VHLETERLLMPPLSAEHTAALAGVYADPEVARYIGDAALDAEGTAAQGVPVLVYELVRPSGRTSRPIARWASGA
jgi:hypothetical protein